jgi:DtxR family Mn-dependent transcriptional regulator
LAKGLSVWLRIKLRELVISVIQVSQDLSQEAEEYIEAIYRLQTRDGAAKTNELAEELGVVPGSITNTIEHLEKHSLVRHQPYKGVRLTEKGRKLALEILRRHRLAERFLTDILNVDWSQVHESACKLEHALTEDIVPLLEERLGHPKFCPHGNPIPTANGEILDQECISLTQVEAETVCKVISIADGKRQNLSRFAQIGIRPGALLKILAKKPQSLIVSVAGEKSPLSRSDASCVCVKKVGEEQVAVQA